MWAAGAQRLGTLHGKAREPVRKGSAARADALGSTQGAAPERNNQKHITTRQLADFIQTQASVKRSDCIAVLDELGFALRHFIGLGEKVKIENVGIFKCGVRNKRGGFEDAKDLTASTLSPRILFQPEYTTSTQNGVTRAAVAMLGDITFEEATDYEAPKEEKPAGTGD